VRYGKKSMKQPRPGGPVRGSSTGRPIMAVLDLLGRRATLRILWELSLAHRPLTFRALQEAAATNPSVLNTRRRPFVAGGLRATPRLVGDLGHRDRAQEQ
jgi:DNA-binding HxlR family transcriptional regulator